MSSAFSAETTVNSFAIKHGLTNVIERAITFDENYRKALTIPVVWNSSLKSSAGYFACPYRNNPAKISLHPGLRREGEAAIRSTFLHELAHAFEFVTTGTTGHSRNWWLAMIRLGELPWETRRHNYKNCQRTETTADRTQAIINEIEL